jgi:hypothetical protein
MLTEAVKNQFNCAFSILEAAIPSFTPEQWRIGRPSFVGPARATAHVLQCADFYTCEDRAVFVNLGKRVWELSDTELPSQERMLQYLPSVRERTLRWIDSIGDAGLAMRKSDEQPIALERLIYAVRHFQHPTGEICAYQKQFGMEPAPWK